VVNENTEVLKQLVESLEKAEEKLERAYKKENHEDFKKTKNFILDAQKKISEIIKV
jgi:exonuclease VII small subunit